MHRDDVLKHWNEAWTTGLWAAPWSKAVDDLTPAQAAWTPAPGRNSIWQIVNHMNFWREYDLRTFAGNKPAAEEIKQHNFDVPPSPPTDQAWNATKQRFAQTQQQIAAIMADASKPLDRVQNHLFHDSYHIGQIMYLRSLQGLKPIE